MTERWTFLSPVAPRPTGAARTGAGSPRLDRPIAGVRVGLEVDYAWNCYTTVVDEWERLLRADGAMPQTLWVERSRNEPQKKSREEIRAEIGEWSKLIECGVVGLGN